MSQDETKEFKQVIDELREKAEKFGNASTDFKEFEEKTQKFIDACDEKNAQLAANIEKERKDREDIKEKVSSLELELARSYKSGNGCYKDAPSYKALSDMCQNGMDSLSLDQKQLLRSDNDVQGGYLVDREMDNEITRQIEEISPIRQVSRVRTVGKRTLEMPIRLSIPQARYEGEAEEQQDSIPNYGTENVTAYALSVTVPVTRDMLLSTDFDIESEISQDVSEAFAQREGNRFILGTGIGQPEGFLNNDTIKTTPLITANSGVISGDDLLELTGQLKTGYNPMFCFNRRVLAKLRQLKGGDGQYLWQAGLGPNVPNTIGGDPYIVAEDMPDSAAGALPIVYADFSRGYGIIDRTGLSVIRDEFTRKNQRIIELAFWRYSTGQVILDEAFKALQIKA